MEKCFVLKDLILRLAKKGKILLEKDETGEQIMLRLLLDPQFL